MSSRPNILHLMVDQQRYDTIAALGNPIIKTPHLDRLVRRGVSFTSAYSPCPVCVPARACMAFGQQPHHTGYYENCCGNPAIEPQLAERQSFMGALTDAGYRTHGVGKCHFMPDRNAMRGFQTRESQEAGYSDPQHNDYARWYTQSGVEYHGDPAGTSSEMYYIPQLAPCPASHHPSNWIGDRSINFLHEHVKSNSDQPFYLYSSFLHPHPPFSPPYPWHVMYRAPQMPLPFVPRDVQALHTYVNKVQNRYKGIDAGWNSNMLRCMKAYYYACISFVDFQVGRILEALEAAGKLDNTMILFTSDHGEFLGDYECFGKRSFHDASARVPLLVSLPGVLPEDTRCDAPASLVDIAPTFCAAAGTQLKTHASDGVSLVDLAAGSSDRDIVFGQHAYTHNVDTTRSRRKPAHDERNIRAQVAATSSYMAVTREWKYFYSAPDDREFLFDRRTDPLETRSKDGLPAYADTLTSLRARLHDHLRAGGETLGIDGNDWKRFPRMDIDPNPDSGQIRQTPDQRTEDLLPPQYRD